MRRNIELLSKLKLTVNEPNAAAVIAAPLDHGLYGLLARLFRGHASRRTRIAEILVAIGVILPIQNAVYREPFPREVWDRATSMTVLFHSGCLVSLHGARKAGQVVTEVKQDLVGVTKVH